MKRDSGTVTVGYEEGLANQLPFIICVQYSSAGYGTANAALVGSTPTGRSILEKRIV